MKDNNNESSSNVIGETEGHYKTGPVHGPSPLSYVVHNANSGPTADAAASLSSILAPAEDIRILSTPVRQQPTISTLSLDLLDTHKMGSRPTAAPTISRINNPGNCRNTINNNNNNNSRLINSSISTNIYQ